MSWFAALSHLHATATSLHATAAAAGVPAAGPTPPPNINTDTVQAGPTPLLMISGLLIAVVLLALSMRRHLRRVPSDLDIATRTSPAQPVAPDAPDASAD